MAAARRGVGVQACPPSRDTQNAVLLGFPRVEPRRPLAPIGLCCLTNGS